MSGEVIGQVILVAITGTNKLVSCHLGKSLQLIRRAVTRRFDLLISGIHLHIMMLSYQNMYRNSCYKDRWSHDCFIFIMEILIPGKTLYWNEPLVFEWVAVNVLRYFGTRIVVLAMATRWNAPVMICVFTTTVSCGRANFLFLCNFSCVHSCLFMNMYEWLNTMYPFWCLFYCCVVVMLLTHWPLGVLN